MKTTKSEQGFAHILPILIIVLLIGGVGVYVLKHRDNSPKQKLTAPAVTNKVKHPGVIQSVVFASSLDASSTTAQSKTSFSPTTPTIYMTLSLKSTKVKVGQKLEYTRYLNSKFVDNGSIDISKEGAKYASFSFTLKPGKAHPKGKYLVKTYTQGIFERSASYTVQ